MNINMKQTLSGIIIFLSLVTAQAMGRETHVVDIGALNVRACPGTACQVIGTVKKGQKLEVLTVEGKWLKININNKTGYVSRKYVKTIDKTIDGIQNRTSEHATAQKTGAPAFFTFMSKAFPVKSVLTWVIMLLLLAMLCFLFYYFKKLDQRFIQFLGSQKGGGVGWPMITTALAGVLLAAALMTKGKEAEWFLTHGIGIIPSCQTTTHWVIYMSFFIGIMSQVGVLVESVMRVGPKFAALRFLMVAAICGITFIVAFYMTILLALIFIIIIALFFGGILLKSMMTPRRVYYYYD
jgi:hypothetical protein